MTAPVVRVAAWDCLADPEAQMTGPVMVGLHIATVRSLGVRCAIAVVGHSARHGVPLVELVHASDDPAAAVAALTQLAGVHSTAGVAIDAGSLSAVALRMYRCPPAVRVLDGNRRASLATWGERVLLRGLRHLGQRDLDAAVLSAERGDNPVEMVAARLALHEFLSSEPDAAVAGDLPVRPRDEALDVGKGGEDLAEDAVESAGADLHGALTGDEFEQALLQGLGRVEVALGVMRAVLKRRGDSHGDSSVGAGCGDRTVEAPSPAGGV